MAQPIATKQLQVKKNYQRQAQVAIIGILAFTAIWVILDFIDPNYNWLEQTGSEHLNGPFRWLMTMAFLSLGAGYWYLASAANAAFDPPVHSRTSVFMLRFSAVCFCLAGLFRAYESFWFGGDPTLFETISSLTHGIASVLAFVAHFIASNTFSNRLRKAGSLKGIYKILQVLAILAIIVNFFTNGQPPPPNQGLMQRIFLFVFLFPWSLLFARGIQTDRLTDG